MTASVTRLIRSWPTSTPYGKWRIGDRQVMRKLGAVRRPGSRKGLTHKQAESSLRTAISTTTAVPLEERLTLVEVGDRYLEHVDHVLERKPSTVADYGYILRRHLGPFFDAKGIDRITPDEIVAYMAAKARDGLATKTVSNHLNFAHGLFSFAVRRGWATNNPVAVVDRPRVSAPNPDIHYLVPEELEALLRAVPDDALGPTERALYLTAAMTGLRQGELVALRCATSTGPPGSSASAATTHVATGERRSRGDRRVPCRWPTA